VVRLGATTSPRTALYAFLTLKLRTLSQGKSSSVKFQRLSDAENQWCLAVRRYSSIEHKLIRDAFGAYSVQASVNDNTKYFLRYAQVGPQSTMCQLG
jgi:hypothetical protein